MNNSKLETAREIGAWQKVFQNPVLWHLCRNSGEPVKGDLWQADKGACRIYLVSSCTSTMDAAWHLHAEGRFPEMSWIAAMEQTSGRGQLGRQWNSRLGNLHVTLRLPGSSLSAGPLLPMAIASILADELASGSVATEIKWPNDLLAGRKKICGILVEEKSGVVMAGIGMNIKNAPLPHCRYLCQDEEEKQGEEYRIDACSLSQFGDKRDAPEFWQAALKRVNETLYELLIDKEDLRKRVSSILAFKGEGVILEDGNGHSNLVRVDDIDITGGLIISASRKQKIIYSGQITPRTAI